MKIVYATRHGHVEALVNKITSDAFKITTGDETCGEDFVIFTYTDGKGEVPAKVASFLQKNSSHLKAVVASGNMEHHQAEFCFSGDVIAKEYSVPCLAKVDGEGTEADVETIKAGIQAL